MDGLRLRDKMENHYFIARTPKAEPLGLTVNPTASNLSTTPRPTVAPERLSGLPI